MPSASLTAQLHSTFAAHLEQLCARTAQALEASGFTSLLVHSGSLLEVFADDRTYPFEPHAPFKVWVPLADAPDSFVWFEPGSRPRLILNQPQDYWYKTAELPADYWVEYFELCSVAGPRCSKRAAAARPVARGLYRGCDRRAQRLECAAPPIRPHCCASAGLCPGRQDPLRARVPARGEPPGGARAPRRCAGLSRPAHRSSRSNSRSWAPAGCASRNSLTTPSSR